MWSKSVWVSQIHRRSAGIDDRPQRGHELLALDDRSGVDQDRLGTVEDEGVDRNDAEAGDGEGRRQHIDA